MDIFTIQAIILQVGMPKVRNTKNKFISVSNIAKLFIAETVALDGLL
jgi:hypothetical protein